MIQSIHASTHYPSFSHKTKPTSETHSGEEQAHAEQISKLKQRDREVRAHEQAHVAAGGNLVRGGPTYTYQYGPDGKRYAIGGHVDIDTSKEKDPEATAKKADQIIKAALAPADPSAQDQQVAANARKMKQEALQEIAKEKHETQSVNQQKASTTYNQPYQEPIISFTL